jgi:asparagine synthase (glutamine-hydrolysing)
MDFEFLTTNPTVWGRDGPGFARGRAFHGEQLWDAQALASATADAGVDGLGDLLTDLHGFFAVGTLDEDGIAIGTDRIRSLPLFVAIEDGTVLVGDDAQGMGEQLSRATWNRPAEIEFSTGGIVTGSDTLITEIRAVQAGETVTIKPVSTCQRDDGFTVQSDRYYQFTYKNSNKRNEEALLASLDTVTRSAFRRLLDVANGRQIAIPLSGGTDSRLVASMLSDLGYSDVVTFSFGRARNRESEVSQSVATALDMPWYFVEYTPEKWRRWYDSERRREYFRKTYQFESVPSITAWPAVGQLVRDGTIDSDAVVVSGDGIATVGEHIPPDFGEEPVTTDRFVETIIDVQFGLWDLPGDAAFALRDRLKKRFAPTASACPLAALQRFDWAERQAKFIVSPGEFADWGLDWWLPLFDPAYMAFYERLPLSAVRDKRLHRRYVDRIFESAAGQPSPGSADRSGYVKAFKDRIASSPVAPIAQRAYDRVNGSKYDRQPMASFGAFPRDLFERLATGQENIHSFKVLELMGRIDPETGSLIDPPAEGVLPWNTWCPDRVDSEAISWLCPVETDSHTHVTLE